MTQTELPASETAGNAPLRIQLGLQDEADRARAARIVYDGFARKFQALRLTKPAALELFALSIEPRMALCAYRGGELRGVLGMVTAERRFLHVPWRRLRERSGPLRALIHHLALNVQHSPAPGVLLIMPLVVAVTSRGQGIGRALMEAVEDYARAHGYTRLCLNVVDTNHAALRLYRLRGFCIVKTTHFGFLTRRAGFASSHSMEKRLLPITKKRPS